MGSVDRQFDVIVVGAGPAGSMAALALARSQHRVLLVDRSTFPRDKVCGDGLPPAVMESLQRVDIHIEDLGIPDMDYKVIQGLEIGSPAQKTIRVHWRPAAYPTLACPRLHFDTILFEKAIQQGAQYLHAHVNRLLFNDDQLVGVQTRDQGEFCADVVIAADGYGSSTARHAGFHLPKGKAVVSAIRAYARLKQPIKPYFHMHFLSELRPGYAWLFPVNNNLANVGLGLAASHLNSEDLRQALVRYLCDWWGDSIELQADTLQQWPIPLWNCDVQTRFRNGVFMIGDAGAFVDPLTGGGIAAAITTGTWAAQTIHQYMNGELSLQEAGDQYEIKWRENLKPRLDHMHRVKTYIADRPTIFSALFNTVCHFPFLKRRVLNTLAGDHT